MWGAKHVIFRLFIFRIFISHAYAYAESIIILSEISPLNGDFSRLEMHDDTSLLQLILCKTISSHHAPGNCFDEDLLEMAGTRRKAFGNGPSLVAHFCRDFWQN